MAMHEGEDCKHFWNVDMCLGQSGDWKYDMLSSITYT